MMSLALIWGCLQEAYVCTYKKIASLQLGLEKNRTTTIIIFFVVAIPAPPSCIKTSYTKVKKPLPLSTSCSLLMRHEH